MSEPIDYNEQEALRYRMETSKERSILIRNWLYTVMAVIVCVMLVWALYAWKMANNMAGTTSANFNNLIVNASGVVSRLETVADKLEKKIDAVDTSKANQLIDAGTKAVNGLPPIERELANAVSDLRQQTSLISRSASTAVEKVGDVADEARAQIHSNGTATANLVNDSNASVNQKLVPEVVEAMKATRILMDKYGLTADEATEAIKQASVQTGKSVDELNKTIIDFHGDLHNTMKEWPTIAKDVEKTTHNISKFSKISIIAGIVSNLANGFLPGLLH